MIKLTICLEILKEDVLSSISEAKHVLKKNCSGSVRREEWKNLNDWADS